MYLKALEIQGFKSFPDRTRLTFEKDITAIVGPNGSGKSNISDAILWVMGEQRSRALRGGKMEDVIFGGTEKRSPMGFAQVSLILDNAAGLFPIDAGELIITRRYYRSGESEYSINREIVRLRDVTELLMDTGLGRDGYSVIGQGRIAEIVSAKSTDRREIFEEAAGIALYRSRKEDAERKLKRTEENLLRINDKIGELELQVGPLEKQAETAKRFLLLRDEQRTLEISVWMETLDALHAQAESLSRDYESAKSSLEQAQRELDAVYAAADGLTEKMRECDLSCEQIRAAQSQEESAAASCESAAAVARTELSHNEEDIRRLRGEIDEQNSRSGDIRSQLAGQDARVSGIAQEKEAITEKIEETLRESEENASETGQAQRELTGLVARENDCGASLAQNAAVLSMEDERLRELDERQRTIDEDLAAGREKYDAATAERRKAAGELAAAREKHDEVTNVIRGHRLLLVGREESERALTEELNRLTVEKNTVSGRVNMLAEMEKEYEGMGKAVKTVMRQAGRGALSGVHGPVGGLLSAEERFARAVETALGAAMQHIVVDSQAAGKAAIELLKRSDAGRATFLPLDTIRPNTLHRVPAGEDGFLGVASELVTYDRRYENIILNLLGRTCVAESLSDAIRISRKFGNQLRIVTLDGQLINAGGSMTGGSAARGSGILSRANELKALRKRLEALSASEAEKREALSEARRELEAAKYELEVAQSELDGAAENVRRWESAEAQCRVLQSAADEALEALEKEKDGLAARLREHRERKDGAIQEKTKLEAELTGIRAEIEKLTGGQERFERRREELGAKLAALRENLASLDAEREALARSRESLCRILETAGMDESRRLAEIAALEEKSASLRTVLEGEEAKASGHRTRAEEHKNRLEALTALRMQLEGERTRNERAGQEKNRALLDMQAVCSRFEQRKLSAEMEESQIVDKLWESYELSRTAAQALRQPVENMAKAQKRVTELRREIGRLGNVNVGAIEEYERVSERYGFFTEQRDDVTKSRRELEKIIRDLTGEMREIFTKQFHAIDEAFRGVFLDLFGGGRASLELEDEENVLECGIEIRVQPPGKAVTTISLLSGGEKSFVAIALYFAIMKVRPTPFCVMDEIDAALDEANVFRYAEYMRSMADRTQFIAITHHRGTMEQADLLYGVTMQEKGVSTVLSVDLDEAESRLAEA